MVCYFLSATERPNATQRYDKVDDPQESDTEYPQILIGFSVFGAAILIGIVVAKVVDMIHDRQSLRDDASDISEFSRNLLRARFTVLAFKATKKEPEEEPVSKMARLWAGKAAAKASREEPGDAEKGQVNLVAYLKTNPDDVSDGSQQDIRDNPDGLSVPVDQQLASTPVDRSPNGTAKPSPFQFPTLPTISAMVSGSADVSLDPTVSIEEPGTSQSDKVVPQSQGAQQKNTKITYVAPKEDADLAGVHKPTPSGSKTTTGIFSKTTTTTASSRPISGKRTNPASRPISARQARPVTAGGRAKPKSAKYLKRVWDAIIGTPVSIA